MKLDLKQVSVVAWNVHDWYQATPLNGSQYSALKPLKNCVNVIVDWYECTSVVLFVCLTWMASNGIQHIIEDVRDNASELFQVAKLETRRWKRSYCLISNFIEEIDGFFELALFFLVIKQFFEFTVFIMDAVLNRLVEESFSSFGWHIVHPLQNVALLSMVVSATQNMKLKVISVNLKV